MVKKCIYMYDWKCLEKCYDYGLRKYWKFWVYNFVWELMGEGKKVEGKEGIFCVKVSK